ncbi:MAG: cytochrome c maturation protein CcmE [Ignavibacteriae bacterium]|nr:cytochrome c maturation protein CcmE [Ignavibacteriota bacterium]NOG97266.1 cytochrome c maturation protein CcmE [Ignavibacteriota bacterium]
MNSKYIFGGIIIVVFFGIMAYLFTQTNVSYEENFALIKQSDKTMKATGQWVKAKSYQVDRENNLFAFFMEDAQGNEMKVVYKGAIPNNFESSTSVVVTGKYRNNRFEATEILTKCPSKYEEQFDATASS